MAVQSNNPTLRLNGAAAFREIGNKFTHFGGQNEESFKISRFDLISGNYWRLIFVYMGKFQFHSSFQNSKMLNA